MEVANVKELRKEAADSLASAEEIIEQAQQDGRELNDDEQAQVDRLTERADQIQKHLAENERLRQLSEKKSQIEAVRGNFNRLPAPQEGITRVQPRITTRPLWEDDPKKGYKDHRAMLLDVMRAGQGGRESAQLQFLRVRGAAGSDEQSTFSDPYGGYLIPIAFMPGLLRIEPEMDPTMGRVTQVPMQASTVEIAARVDKNHSTSVSGGLRVYRRAEADTVASLRMEFERITLHANSLMGISYATEEILSESPMSFIAILQAGFSDEFDSKILDERLNGTGVGEFLGINNSPALISVARQLAGEIDYLDIINMMARAWRYRNCIWLANHDVIPQLGQLSLTVGAGGSAIFVQNAAVDMPSTLMGRPLFYSEYVNALGTAGDLMLIDWSQYLEGTYQPLQTAESIHVRFVNAERAFRFMMRNDGAPWWRTALTPKRGANTLSPYVRLAA
jgi:HK97 family phage major capsid protein